MAYNPVVRNTKMLHNDGSRSNSGLDTTQAIAWHAWPTNSETEVIQHQYTDSGHEIQ